jgi:predicted SAM-dependent methyltransferase
MFNRYVAALNYLALRPLGLALQPATDTETVYEALRREQLRLADARRQLDDLRSNLKQLSPINLSPDELYEKLFPRESLDNKRFYNFGSGDWRHRYWTNVDYNSAYYRYGRSLIDIRWDIASGEPVKIESNSAELVYCSHTVEHLLDEHVDHMLREAHRVLKTGGVIRITTPNAALLYWAYKRRDANFNRHYGADYGFGENDTTYSIERMPIWIVNEIATQLVQGVHGEERIGAKLLENTTEIDRIFDQSRTMEEAFSAICGMIDFRLQREAPGQHVNWWTNQKLEGACRRAGFEHTVVNVPGGSVSPVMRNRNYFDLVDSTYSIFVDAIK